MRTLLIILLILCYAKLSKAQSIEKFSIDNGGASSTNGGLEILYTIGEVNVKERSSAMASLSEGFINPEFRVLVDPKLFLQGPILAPITVGLMNDELRSLGYLPTTSPYADLAMVAASIFNTGGTSGSGLPQDDIVDWVWLELRAANDNTKIINARSALLQRDGDVVDLDGLSNVLMRAAPTNYFLVVTHRNHLAAMSSSAIGFSETPVGVDFTDNTFSTFGANAQVQLASGDMALWTGDTNGADQIRFSGSGNGTNVIKDHVLADPANGFNSVTFSSMGYLNIDLNLDGIGRFSGSGNDSNIIKDNVLVHPGNGFGSVTYIIEATVPPGN